VILIVGGGVAGWTAAETLRSVGHRGRIRLLSAEPVEPYERPVLSKAFLLDPALRDPPRLPGSAEALGVELQTGTTAAHLDPAARLVVTSSGDDVRYERLLLAMGAAPRTLGIPGGELDGVHHLRDLADARALRQELRPGRRVAVVGGGVIGLEVAASARRRGCAVSVVEAGPQLLGRVAPSAFADLVEAVHRANGVRVHARSRPTAFLATGRRVAGVRLAGGKVVPADVVVVGVGVTPRTSLAEEAGLAVQDGVLVDAMFRTSDPRVFAAGDVARVRHPAIERPVRMEQWRSAEAQGRAAAASMAGRGDAYRGVPSMWSDQYDLQMQAAGFGFADTDVVSLGRLDDRSGIVFLGLREDRVAAACGLSHGTGVARAVRSAERLIELGLPVDHDALLAPDVDLRRFAREAAQRAAAR
jgi:3-phenylpropionate/trans-cinnamate dioxygenase ferredoxin reductase subunit